MRSAPAVLVDEEAVDAPPDPAPASPPVSDSHCSLVQSPHTSKDPALACHMTAAQYTYTHCSNQATAYTGKGEAGNPDVRGSLEEAKLAPVGAPGVPDNPVGLAVLLSPASDLHPAHLSSHYEKSSISK